MRLLLILLVGCVAATNIIEGSGNDSGSKHSVSSPDMEIHGSGYGSDDEDGDAVHGSGVPGVDVIEASGIPPLVQQRPQLTTTTTTTHMPPIHSHSDSERSQTTGTIMTTPSIPTSTRRVLILPATTPDPTATQSPFHPVLKPGIFAAVVGGTVVGLLTAILLVMFIVYRMRKKDEGSYALEEPKPRPYPSYAYTKASTKEFYA
ncbi:hypothetical protein KIN20_036716 [Parelaphostrongylus tenuis]|uniref:Syndecan n=1 Tax=Parelaphostrongylus tenuis TaxID=148309 RepID=A0AAD5RCY5_PARTN|nr:hypothetical protein KIN20_036716 [Parelaphostrongylus tenuis]